MGWQWSARDFEGYHDACRKNGKNFRQHTGCEPTAELSPKTGEIDLNESDQSVSSSITLEKEESCILAEESLDTDPLTLQNKGNSKTAGKNEITLETGYLESSALSHCDLPLNICSKKPTVSDPGSSKLSVQKMSALFSEMASVHAFDQKTSNLSQTENEASPVTKITGSLIVPSICNTSELSVDTTSSKTLNSLSKTESTQVVIVQKPVVTSSSVVVQTKNVMPIVSSVGSGTNVTVVQPVIGPSGATKVVTIPAVGLLPSGNSVNSSMPVSLSAIKGTDVKVIVPQAGGSSATLVPVSHLSSTGNASNTQQAALKRAVTPSGSQVITKVIITNNPSTNQSSITPIPVSVNVTSSGTHSVVSQSQSVLLSSPTKTLTLSTNIVNSSGAQQIFRTIPGTPSKQGMFVLSPVKTASKITTLPVSVAKSPRRIAPATNTTLSAVVTGSKVSAVSSTAAAASTVTTMSRSTVSLQQSPTKVILKPVPPQTILKPVVSNSNTSLPVSANFSSVIGASSATAAHQVASSIAGASPQQVQVPGSKFHYVRLVSAPSTAATTSTVTKQATLIPVSSARALGSALVPVTSSPSVATATSGGVRLTVPIAPAIATQNQAAPKQAGQRFLIPAPTVASVAQLRPNSSVPAGQLGQLPAGTLIPVGGTAQGFVMVPAHYVTQLPQPSQSHIQGPRMVIQPVQHQSILPAPVSAATTPVASQPTTYVPIAASSASHAFQPQNIQPGPLPSQPQSRHHVNGRSALESNDSRPRKPCNCTKSQCLKLYCDCFANGEFCNNCNCNNCYNNLAHEEERQKAIKACLDRNPLAFHPKIGKSKEGDQERRHTKGCNCKRSGCLKNYCECYEAKILCTSLCKCIGCKNFEDSSERKTLMHLADAAEVRVQQQAAAKTKLSSQIQDLPTKPPIVSTTGEKLPFAFVTQEVVEATCVCLLAQTEDGERTGMPVSVIEKLVLDEFGRCLMQIIDCANKTKA